MSSLLQLHHLSGACHACTSSWYPLSIREPQLNEFYIASDHLFHCLLHDELLGIITNILVWHFSSYSNEATRGERKSKIMQILRLDFKKKNKRLLQVYAYISLYPIGTAVCSRNERLVGSGVVIIWGCLCARAGWGVYFLQGVLEGGSSGLDAQPNHHSKPRNNRGPDKYNVSKYNKF